jgi:N-methylhydantoinase A
MSVAGAEKRIRIAVDIGGTFTDIALLTEAGVIHQSKISSSPADPSRAVVEGVAQLLAELSIPSEAIAEILHGTTVGSNTILQRKGAKTGLITTRGFRDILEIGRIRMPGMFDLTWDKPKPLVPRRHRMEVAERLAADGSLVEPLSEAGLLSAVETLVADGIEAVAIVFINSYRNPVHELEAEAIIRRHFPNLLVTTSCTVLPEIKEYERTSTTVVNAYLLAAMRDYLQKLEAGFRSIGIAAPILVMTSSGGMLAANVSCEKPVMVVASGPAGGVMGAARLGAARNDRDVIVFDMGGTTAKAVIIEDGRPTMTSEYEFRDGISTSSRFIKAGGYMLKVPAIDIAEVGAGGGSIAGIDKGGLLTVGPHSAGAVPGPVCYDLGNDKPTVTDANVVLGFINATSLAGGKLNIKRELSERSIREFVGKPLGISLEDAAHGVRAVANAAMARAIRAVTVERGRDPRDLTLMAFGGNGGVHAPDLARQLGIPRVVVPPMSGIFSALGMLASDIEHAALRTVSRCLDQMTVAELKAIKSDLQQQVAGQLASDGYFEDRTLFLWEADLRHEGQATELTVPFEGEDFPQIRDRFVAEYLKTYGYRDTTQIELMKVRVTGRGLRDNRLDFGNMQMAARAGSSQSGARLVSFARGQTAVSVEIVGRDMVGPCGRQGPLIIEEFDATTVVPPDARVHTDAIGCLVLEFDA